MGEAYLSIYIASNFILSFASRDSGYFTPHVYMALKGDYIYYILVNK